MKKYKLSQLKSNKEVFAEMYDTPEKLLEFEKRYEKHRLENQAELRAETAKVVRKARTDSGMTQAELARRLKTKSSTISRIEAGKQNITQDYLVRIATALERQVFITIV